MTKEEREQYEMNLWIRSYFRAVDWNEKESGPKPTDVANKVLGEFRKAFPQ